MYEFVMLIISHDDTICPSGKMVSSWHIDEMQS